MINDPRYTTHLEWCGYPEPRYVVRFCGEWVGQSLFKSSAIMMAAGYKAKMQGALIVEEIPPSPTPQ